MEKILVLAVMLLLTGSAFCQDVTPLWDIVDDCLSQANMNRNEIEESYQNNAYESYWEERWSQCSLSHLVLNCLLSNITDCLDPNGFAEEIFDFMDRFHIYCDDFHYSRYYRFKPGTCRANGNADCFLTETYPGTNHTTPTYCYLDRDCPHLYKCCNETCKKALPPPPGCDFHAATNCLLQVIGGASYMNRDQFCAEYVFPLETCVNNRVSSCDSESLAEWENEASFYRDLRVDVSSCGRDICYGRCGANGDCRPFPDEPFNFTEYEQPWEYLHTFRVRQSYAWYCECHPHYEGELCDELECRKFDVQIDLAELSFLQGIYEEFHIFLQSTDSYVYGYISENYQHYMMFYNRTRSFISATSLQFLVNITEEGGSDTINWVDGGLINLGINITGQTVDFGSTTCLGGSIFYWPVVDQCLADSNLTRGFLYRGIVYIDWKQRESVCGARDDAVNCILANFPQCMEPNGDSQNVIDFVKHNVHCSVDSWSHPGICPDPEPDCNGTDVDSCSRPGDCSYLHQCCNGTCVRSAPTKPGCDFLPALHCRGKLLDNAVYYNRQQFCDQYVSEHERCFERNIENCSSSYLEEIADGGSRFTWEYERLLIVVAACDFNPCEPSPCGPNATCVDQTFPEPVPEGQDGEGIWNTMAREQWQDQSHRCDCVWPIGGPTCDEISCGLVKITPHWSELDNFTGRYEVGTTPFGVLGYNSKNGLYFSVPSDNGTISVHSTSDESLLLVMDKEETILQYVNPSLEIDHMVGRYSGFNDIICLDGKLHLYDFGQFTGVFQVQGQVTGYPLSQPLRIGCDTYSRICVYLHGFIAFTNKPNCPPAEAAQFSVLPPIQGIPDLPQFAAFAARQEIVPSSGGAVYYAAHFSGADVIRATQDVRNQGFSDFDAKAVYVVTWDSISPHRASQFLPNTRLTNTYQFVIASDFVRTFVMTRHDVDAMEAMSQNYFNVSNNINLQFGYYFDDEVDDMADNSPYPPSNDKGVYIATNGRSEDERGRFWFKDITNYNKTAELTPCQNWILNNATELFEYDSCDADACPPSEIFAIASRYQCLEEDPHFAHRTCYVRWNWVRPDNWRENGWSWGDFPIGKSVCCYTKAPLACSSSVTANLVLERDETTGRGGSLITTRDFAGFLRLYQPVPVNHTYTWTWNGVTETYTYTYYSYISNDMDGWEICCLNGSASDCDLFYNVRPVAHSWCFVIRILAFLRGDPHITTLDGVTYTFNGHGEYVLLTTDDESFEIQARTAPIQLEVNGTLVDGNATKFVGIVMYDQATSDSIQIELDDPKSDNATMGLFIKGQATDASTNPSSAGGTTVTYNSADSWTVTFASDWNIEVQVSNGVMLFIVIVPPSETSKVRGLLGTPNNNTDDDFTLRNGTVIPSDSSSEEIFYQFGELWRTDPGSSKFTYHGSNDWNTWNDMSYVPAFSDGVIDPALVTACGGDELCAFDLQQTGNPNIAQDTANANKNFNNDSVIRSNSVPTLTILNGTTITLVAGEDVTLVVELNDADAGDVVELRAADGYNTSCLTISGNTVTIAADDLMGCNIALIAVDSNNVGSAVVPVTVVECPACVNGHCNVDTAQVISAYLKNASCACDLGWMDTTCEVDIDACASEPCGNTTCVDLTPQQQQENNTVGYMCEEVQSMSPSISPSETESGSSESIDEPKSSESSEELDSSESIDQPDSSESIDGSNSTEEEESMSPSISPSETEADTSSTESGESTDGSESDDDDDSASPSDTSSIESVESSEGTESDNDDDSESSESIEANHMGALFIRLQITFNVDSALCLSVTWKIKVQSRLGVIHSQRIARTVTILNCTAGSAVILYVVGNPTNVTDEERAETIVELLGAIDPDSNSLLIDGAQTPLDGNPVLLLDGDTKKVELLDFCTYFTEQNLCPSGERCELDDDNNPVCRETKDGSSDTVLIVTLSVAAAIAALVVFVVVLYVLRKRTMARRYDEYKGHRYDTVNSVGSSSSGGMRGAARYHNWYRGWTPDAAWMRRQAQTPVRYQGGGYLSNNVYTQSTQPALQSKVGQYGQYRQYGQRGYQPRKLSAYSTGYY